MELDQTVPLLTSVYSVHHCHRMYSEYHSVIVQDVPQCTVCTMVNSAAYVTCPSTPPVQFQNAYLTVYPVCHAQDFRMSSRPMIWRRFLTRPVRPLPPALGNLLCLLLKKKGPGKCFIDEIKCRHRHLKMQQLGNYQLPYHAVSKTWPVFKGPISYHIVSCVFFSFLVGH